MEADCWIIATDAPAHLKKELDTVLTLQTELDGSERALQNVRTIIEKGQVSRDTRDALASLKCGHERLLDKVDALYSSLNIQDRFPELDGVNFQFVQTLLLAQDLKINIRKQAIGSFFEWDKLDRAVDGKQKALGWSFWYCIALSDICPQGTKLHQQTCQAIAKWQPALMSSIHKYNNYCALLEELYDPSYGILLPTKLAELHNNQTLLEDIWITCSHGDILLWLKDHDVREGIRALLKWEWCREEQLCLRMEAGNMCWWFGCELCVVELTLQQPQCEFFHWHWFD